MTTLLAWIGGFAVGVFWVVIFTLFRPIDERPDDVP